MFFNRRRPTDQGAVVENPLRFAGQYFDSETGLHYNYHRYYDSSLGRYLRDDPIGLAGGVNPYLYTLNNPLIAIDPQGLKAICIPWFARKTAWKEAWSLEPAWEFKGENIIKVGVSGACHWTKYKKGEKERDVTERELCCEWECDVKKCYIKDGRTTKETKPFKEVIDTDITPINWVRPVGGFAWQWECDRNYRSPFLPRKD